MIVAGSVLALLLMGLAVDGFVNPADEEPEDHSPEAEANAEGADQTDEDDGLTTLLEAGSDDAEEEDDTAEDTRAEDLAEDLTGPLTSPIAPTSETQAEGESLEEARADAEWTEATTAVPAADFLDIHATTEIEGGESVAYVDGFDPATDTLVLEFDGSAAEAPRIDVEYDPEDDSAIVYANDVPVTLLEGAEGITPDHVRVVMGGDTSDLGPQVQPDSEAYEARERVPDTTGPLIEPTVEVAVEETTSEDRLEQGEDPSAPLTSPVFDLTEPLEDLTDTVEDLLPDDSVIGAILDQVTADLTDVGGMSEMLDARTDIDDAFGTGGEDALTGSFNDDLVTGGDGQDALFGDEGHDTLMGGDGNDELHGDTGDDNLQGEEGVDFLDGGEGNDTLDGGGDRDLLFGGEGDDVLYGGAASDFLQGGLGSDTLDGGSGDDTLDGVYGDGTSDQDAGDALWGGTGDDHIILGQGDTAHGGTGADTFTSGSYIENAEVAGHVADFNPNEDRIEVIFDPAESPDPTLEVLDFADGSGADIILNGQVILSVAGAQGLDPNMIELQARV